MAIPAIPALMMLGGAAWAAYHKFGKKEAAPLPTPEPTPPVYKGPVAPVAPAPKPITVDPSNLGTLPLGTPGDVTTLALPTGSPPLREGSRGTDVQKWQTFLQVMSYDVGPLDGIFGSKTKTATQTFQKFRNLTADGVVGPLTIAAAKTALTQLDYS